MSGPLSGLRVVEMAGIGPGPHAAMLLADLGADVVRIDRRVPTTSPDGIPDADRAMWRGRRIVNADLKSMDEHDQVAQLVDYADVLIEGFRPGVMERLGLGPTECLERNPTLIYGRMTGWGQDGPWADRAGHDINYIAATGILRAMGPPNAPPLPPLNLVGDFGGGSMLLVVGVLAALWERDRSGSGQVIDAAMVDGANLLGQLLWSWRAAGRWSDERGTNLLDGSAPFYRTYSCADGEYIAVGALEPTFYDALIAGLDLDPTILPDRWDRASWPHLGDVFAERFAQKSRGSWTQVFDDIDACVTGVSSLSEAPQHPHLAARASYVVIDGTPQPAPAPRFSRSISDTPNTATDSRLTDLLTEWKTSPR